MSLTDEQTRAVEYLAGETLRYWQDQAKERRITTPSAAAVGWQWAGHDLAVPPDEVGAQVPTSGVVTQLREELYGRLEEQSRVVILGGPGAGKTAAMLSLLIDILTHRPAGSLQPVPVWLTLGGWNLGGRNPQTTVTLRQWVATTLTRDYPGLTAAAHGGPGAVDELIRTRRVALFLDGLDELPPAVQGKALQTIDRDWAGAHLVLTSRSDEYRTALKQGRLWGAAVIDLLPVDLQHAETFLLAEQLPNQRQAWQHVIDVMRAEPDSVPARTLTTPLALSLARDTYTRADPAELLDIRAHPTPEALLQHLLTRFLDLAYPDPRQRQHAIRWLGWIARHMGTNRDLRWWDIPTWLPLWQRKLVLAGGFGVVLALGLVFGIVGGLVGVLTCGLVVGLTSPRKPQPQALVIRRLDRREIRDLITVGLVFAYVFGLVVGLAPGYTGELAGGLSPGLGFALMGAVGLVFGLVVGLVDHWSRPLANAQAVSPIEVHRSDRQHALVYGLVYGLVVGLGVGLVFGLAGGFAGGLAIGLAGWLGFGMDSGAAVQLTASETIWKLHGQRVGFLPLLQTALDRQVLRQVGALYQFRHAALQDLLINSCPDEATTRSLPPTSVPEPVVSGTPDDVDQTHRSASRSPDSA